MGKYPISRELRPFDSFRPPVSRPFLALARAFMGEPGFLRRDSTLSVTRVHVLRGGGDAELLLIRPSELPSPAPCIFYVHGGGFVFKAARYHYLLAARYARECGCVTAFVQYRLAPAHPFPEPLEDCFGAYMHLLENAAELGIDAGRIGVAGDSAGAALAVGTAMRLRDSGIRPGPRFQMLPYPFLDAGNDSDSARKYTDTPMWNSRLSAKVTRYTRPDRSSPLYKYYSPLAAEDLSALPPAYMEAAEFDCLHDDAAAYAERLLRAGVPAELHEIKGTMHGFDIVQSSSAAQRCAEERIRFMKKYIR